MEARTWIDRYAEALGVSAPTETEVRELLALAGIAAHTSERTAAPVSCWLAAQAGFTTADALACAQTLEKAILDQS